jgi:hypothetical protein
MNDTTTETPSCKRGTCKEAPWADTGYCAKHQPRANKYTPPPKIRPLPAGKPLAPYRAPALKAFDRHLPGQGMLDLDADGEFAVVYPEDEDQAS